VCERRGQALALGVADASVRETGGGARGVEIGAGRERQRAHPPGGAEVLDHVEVDVEGVERERAQRAVRAGLEHRHLGDGQELEHGMPRRCEPATEIRQVAEVADAPVARAAQAEEREENARSPIRHAFRPGALRAPR
jgi:hypothetical protein